jgi:predicted extracellular nuclease
LRQEVDQKLAGVQGDVNDLKSRFGNYERQVVVTELKRALVSIQGITGNAPEDVQNKSTQVVASIQSLLDELEGKSTGAPITPMTTPAPETTAPAPVEESAAEDKEEEAASETVTATEETTTEEAPVGQIELESEGAQSESEEGEEFPESGESEEAAAEEEDEGGEDEFAEEGFE